MRNIRYLLFMPALAGLLLLTAPGEALAQYHGAEPAPPAPRGTMQQPNPHGYKHRPHFYLNAELTGMAILDQQLDDMGTLSHGAGFGIGLGVRTGRWVSIEGNWTFTAHDEIWSDGEYEYWEIDSHQVQTITLDAKIHLPTWGIAEPFAQVGAGYAFYGLSGFSPYYEEFDYAYQLTSGPTFSVGGGGELWFGPNVSLGARILYRGMYFGESRYGIRATKKSTGDPTTRQVGSNFISALTLDVFATLHL